MSRRPGTLEAPALPPEIVEAAIGWYVRLSSGPDGGDERRAFRQWLEADRRHAQAWERMARLGARFAEKRAAVAAPLAIDALDAGARLQGRRRALKALAWASTCGGAAWLLHDRVAWPQPLDALVADLSTATGAQQVHRLPDGSRLRMNTATAVDLHFSDRQRVIRLRSGEIEIDTAPDPRARPFLVQTRDGALRPLGTRFCVRHDAGDDATFLAVAAGAVEVAPAASMRSRIVQAGRQLRFDRHRLQAEEALDPRRTAWTEGLITARRTPLDAFVRELDRYHPARLRCAPEIARLQLTAVYRLHGPGAPDGILASLEHVLPVRIDRSARFRITVAPRG